MPDAAAIDGGGHAFVSASSGKARRCRTGPHQDGSTPEGRGLLRALGASRPGSRAGLVSRRARPRQRHSDGRSAFLRGVPERFGVAPMPAGRRRHAATSRSRTSAACGRGSSRVTRPCNLRAGFPEVLLERTHPCADSGGHMRVRTTASSRGGSHPGRRQPLVPERRTGAVQSHRRVRTEPVGSGQRVRALSAGPRTRRPTTSWIRCWSRRALRARRPSLQQRRDLGRAVRAIRLDSRAASGRRTRSSSRGDELRRGRRRERGTMAST